MLKYLYLLILIFVLNIGLSQNDWLFKGKKSNINIYYKKTADVYDLKLTTSVRSSDEGFIKLLSEVEMFPNWIYKVKSSRLIKKISETEGIYYILLDFPWPLNDRDMVMHYHLEVDKKHEIIYSRSYAEHDIVPEVKDVIRITNAKLEWKIFKQQNEYVYFEYTIHSDPGGKIPDWLVNLVLDKGPIETIKKMKTYLEKPEYFLEKKRFF